MGGAGKGSAQSGPALSPTFGGGPGGRGGHGVQPERGVPSCGGSAFGRAIGMLSCHPLAFVAEETYLLDLDSCMCMLELRHP